MTHEDLEDLINDIDLYVLTIDDPQERRKAFNKVVTLYDESLLYDIDPNEYAISTGNDLEDQPND